MRLSETQEIQLAFQQEMARILNEAGANADVPLLLAQIPATVTGLGIIDGNGLREGLDDIERNGTLQTLGFKPEHIRVFKSLAFLLGQCSRLEATAQNLAICEPLFHPGHPITPTVADAAEEVITALFESIATVGNTVEEINGDMIESSGRLSDAKEIQAAFRREVDALFAEIGMQSLFTDKDTEIVDPKSFLVIFDSVEGHTLESVGFKSEHIRVLRALTFLLERCTHVGATKQNLRSFEPLFHPVKPTSAASAKAYEEAIMGAERSVEGR